MFACPHKPLHRLTVLVAGLFGLLTIAAGGRLLLGLGEAGYVVVWPILIFNTVMGAVYVAAAVLMARDIDRGRRAAFAIAMLNVVVLVGLGVLRARGGIVASETLAAMSMRALVWIGIFALLTWERRAPRSHHASSA